jgi:hypothetical protein
MVILLSELIFYSSVACTAIMATGIIFTIVIQLRVPVSIYLTFVFESVKSVLATGMWLWLILDAAFGPWQRDYYYPGPDLDRRIRTKVIRAALSSVVLL